MQYVSEIFILGGLKHLAEIDAEIKSILLSEVTQELQVLAMKEKLAVEKSRLHKSNANIADQQQTLKSYKQNTGKRANPNTVLRMQKNINVWNNQTKIYNAGIKKFQSRIVDLLKKAA